MELLPYGMKANGDRMPNAKGPRGSKSAVKLPPTGVRYSARQFLTDVAAGELVPRFDEANQVHEAGTFLTFLKGNVPTVDALCCLPAAKGDEIFGAGSTLAGGLGAVAGDGNAGMTVLALQVTVNLEHKLNGLGLQCVLNTVMRACGPGQHCVHYVVVTNERCAGDMEWTKPTAVEPADPRFAKVRQYVLAVDEQAVMTATRGEKF